MPPFVLGLGAQDFEAGNVGQQLMGVAREQQLVGADAFHADFLQILNGFAHADGGDDDGRAGFEFVGQVGGREAFGGDAA